MIFILLFFLNAIICRTERERETQKKTEILDMHLIRALESSAVKMYFQDFYMRK